MESKETIVNVNKNSVKLFIKDDSKEDIAVPFLYCRFIPVLVI